MKYQLTLQFPASSIADYDEMIEIENALSNKLPGIAKVDEHDCGSGEMNIFIFTDEPTTVFKEIKQVLARSRKFEKLVAAYREIDGKEYTTLWPRGHNRPFKIT